MAEVKAKTEEVDEVEGASPLAHAGERGGSVGLLCTNQHAPYYQQLELTSASGTLCPQGSSSSSRTPTLPLKMVVSSLQLQPRNGLTSHWKLFR